MVNRRTLAGGRDFLFYKQYIVVTLPDNFTEAIVDSIELQVLDCLAANRKIKGVLVGFDAVATSDLNDLQRLTVMLQSACVMGAVIGVFGMHPGLAALIAKLQICLPMQAAGHDLEDLLEQLKIR